MKVFGVLLNTAVAVVGSLVISLPMSNVALAASKTQTTEQPSSSQQLSSQQEPSEQSEWLPESGVAWHYSPLAVPTEMKPLSQSMAAMLSRGYVIKTTNNYPNGLLFTLARGKNNVICVFNPPEIGTDQNVPTSRCWALN